MASKYKENDPEFVWDGIWHVIIKPKDDVVIPSYILCDEDHWQVEYPGSVRRCYKCLRDGHPHWRCPARERQPQDGEVAWEEAFGPHVDKISIIRDENSRDKEEPAMVSKVNLGNNNSNNVSNDVNLNPSNQSLSGKRRRRRKRQIGYKVQDSCTNSSEDESESVDSLERPLKKPIIPDMSSSPNSSQT